MQFVLTLEFQFAVAVSQIYFEDTFVTSQDNVLTVLAELTDKDVAHVIHAFRID